jgi:beta-lactamase class A
MRVHEPLSLPGSHSPDIGADSPRVSRRGVLGVGTAIVVGGAAVGKVGDFFGLDKEFETVPDLDLVGAYQTEVESLDGLVSWASMVSLRQPDGSWQTPIEDYADAPRQAGSVNKLAAALAVLDQRDHGILDLAQTVRVPEDVADPGEKRQLPPVATVESLLKEMIVNSSNEAFRALQAVVSGQEINHILRSKGLLRTSLTPSPNPDRYFTGVTTPRDAHKLLQGLTESTLLSRGSSQFLLHLMQESTFNLGVRRFLDSEERAHVATKYGQLEDAWAEVGVMFGKATDGSLVARSIYAFFAHNLDSSSGVPVVEEEVNKLNQVAAVNAHAKLGRILQNIVNLSPRTRAQQAVKRRGLFSRLVGH